MEIINTMFTSTALLAVFTYLGYQLRSVPNIILEQIRKLFIYSVHIEQTSELFNFFENWLKNYHENSFKNVKAQLTIDLRSEDDNLKRYKLELQHYSDMFILNYKGKRLLIKKNREKLENVTEIRNLFFNNYSIEGWWAKERILELLDDIIEYNKTINRIRQVIYTNNDYGDWTSFGEVYGKSVDNIVLKDKQKILDNITEFISKEEWYLKRGLLYKRGYLFYGAPGNGKTSLCLALAKYFNRDIYFLNLNDIEKDSSLFQSFNSIKNNSILVIEDVDVIFGTRDGKSKISFSALLNCMDGAFSKYGIITIMTTNYPDRIDDALIREGRIDMKIEINNPEKEMVEEYLMIFYGKEVKLDEYKNIFSMSKIQEICLQNKDNLQETLNNLYNKNGRIR